MGPKNRDLLAKREDIQAQIDSWHKSRRGQPHDQAAYKAFLTEIGYLVPEGPAFSIDTPNVDAEIATLAGPQLVVPVMNARYALNAATRAGAACTMHFMALTRYLKMTVPRALAATTLRAEPKLSHGRGRSWIKRTLASGSHSDATGYAVQNGVLIVSTNNGDTGLADPAQFAGYRGDAGAPSAVLVKNNRLHAES